jgi:predicted Fe-Mo cluster-binding NifX family protein
MKIAIPLAEGKLCAHFGHCAEFAFITVEDGKITDKELKTPPPHEPGVLPAWLSEQQVSQIIAGGMGQRARQLFAANGINVSVGAQPDTPENIVEQFLAGTLTTGDNLCDH